MSQLDMQGITGAKLRLFDKDRNTGAFAVVKVADKKGFEVALYFDDAEAASAVCDAINKAAKARSAEERREIEREWAA